MSARQVALRAERLGQETDISTALCPIDVMRKGASTAPLIPVLDLGAHEIATFHRLFHIFLFSSCRRVGEHQGLGRWPAEY